jgi:hypothetical protein
MPGVVRLSSILLRLSLGVFGCFAAFGQSAPADAVQKMFANSCVSCHSGAKPAGKLDLTTLTAMMKGGASGPTVIAGNAEKSPLFQRIATHDTSLRMPPAGAPVDAETVAAVKRWIESLAPVPEFVSHVRPILEKNCYACHGGAAAKSQLRLDAPAGILRGGLSGPVIVPGKAANSRLVDRIEGLGGEQRMPLRMPALSAAEISTIKAWIDAGAKMPADASNGAAELEKHWSYSKPVRPPVPVIPNAAHPVDAFLLAKLQQHGLGFSPPASKETLIRRVSLDLIGLPPTPAEVDEFINDTRPDAYDRLVNRLLASPHYGERWARHWLDLARYADTHGYEKDDRRSVWKYRDWIIDAFNRDMPYDQFTIEQIAGDMLPNATAEQKIATGFHRNTMLNEEGGVDKDEAYFEVLVDRVNTTASVWLGSTLGCAQCHNHKYDPFTHKDYYQLMAFFTNNKKEAIPHGTGFKYSEPTLDLATGEQEERRKQIRSRIDELEKTLKTPTPDLDKEQAKWERTVLNAVRDWKTLVPSKAEAVAGSTLTVLQDGIISATGDNPQRETYSLEMRPTGKTLHGLRLEALPDASLPRGGPGRDVYGNFVVTDVEVEVGNGTAWRPLRFQRVVADDGRVRPKNSRQTWIVDASREDTRLPRQLVLVPEAPVKVAQGELLRVRIVQDSDYLGQTVGRFRLSMTDKADDPAMIVKLRPKLRPVLATKREARSAETAKELAEFFRGVATSLEPAREELRERKNELEKLHIASTYVMEEAAPIERPIDHVRIRGAFGSKGEQVSADVPAALGGFPAGIPPNRLGLAKWLASRENPLTARVAVNRIWEHYFGHGIVETSEDFGTQGERPSHPELLDWLAVEFMDRGWSFKALHRLIVTSTAYRQASNMTPEVLQADPYNRLISRGPRFRMEAEMLRDAGLRISGLLSAKIGGPSVFPPQPEGVWSIPYNDDKWEESKGEDKYRRGIYTFVRRSAMYPAMMNFDAGSREACLVRRIRTNTPLAALTTLNDPAFFEMARALAKRMVTEAGPSDSARVRHGFRLATARAPKGEEMDRLVTWLDKERKYFAAHEQEATDLGGDVAPWTMLANVLLNLDEALTKE